MRKYCYKTIYALEKLGELIRTSKVTLVMALLIIPSFGVACEVRPIRIEGHSLAPRISNGSIIDVEIGTDCNATPDRGEVVLFASRARPIPVAKVVVGLPSDEWGVSAAGYVNVNGQRAVNSEGKPYRLNSARTRMLKLYEREYSGTIPTNTYLLLGERANGTLDSSRLGLIHRRDIIGRVVGEQ